jgi:hypothetical protein
MKMKLHALGLAVRILEDDSIVQILEAGLVERVVGLDSTQRILDVDLDVDSIVRGLDHGLTVQILGLDSTGYTVGLGRRLEAVSVVKILSGTQVGQIPKNTLAVENLEPAMAGYNHDQGSAEPVLMPLLAVQNPDSAYFVVS